MKITYWSDFACPYCYIGNIRLKRAIEELEINGDIEFDIRAFELDQNAPKSVESSTVERFALKYGLSVEDAQNEVDGISKLGINEGIDFKYSTTLYTNTRDAHRLMKLAGDKYDSNVVERLSNLLFDAYFSKNLKLADSEVLLDISKKSGLDELDAKDVLSSDSYDDEVQKDEEIALANGIHGVPFYLLDGKYSVPGALSYDDFKTVLSQIITENRMDEDKDANACRDGVCRL